MFVSRGIGAYFEIGCAPQKYAASLACHWTCPTDVKCVVPVQNSRTMGVKHSGQIRVTWTTQHPAAARDRPRSFGVTVHAFWVPAPYGRSRVRPSAFYSGAAFVFVDVPYSHGYHGAEKH